MASWKLWWLHNKWSQGYNKQLPVATPIQSITAHLTQMSAHGNQVTTQRECELFRKRKSQTKSNARRQGKKKKKTQEVNKKCHLDVKKRGKTGAAGKENPHLPTLPCGLLLSSILTLGIETTEMLRRFLINHHKEIMRPQKDNSKMPSKRIETRYKNYSSNQNL